MWVIFMNKASVVTYLDTQYGIREKAMQRKHPESQVTCGKDLGVPHWPSENAAQMARLKQSGQHPIQEGVLSGKRTPAKELYDTTSRR